MQYYGPRRRSTDRRWDYTVRYDNNIFPVGYCAPYRPLTKEACAAVGIPFRQEYLEMQARFEGKHHDDGHTTEREACVCYRSYLLDQQVTVRESLHKEPRECSAPSCYDKTQGGILLEGTVYFLCEKHRNRQTYEQIIGPVSEVWKS